MPMIVGAVARPVAKSAERCATVAHPAGSSFPTSKRPHSPLRFLASHLAASVDRVAHLASLDGERSGGDSGGCGGLRGRTWRQGLIENVFKRRDRGAFRESFLRGIMSSVKQMIVALLLHAAFFELFATIAGAGVISADMLCRLARIEGRNGCDVPR